MSRNKQMIPITSLFDEISQNFFRIRDQHGRYSRNRCIHVYVKYYYFEYYDFGAL